MTGKGQSSIIVLSKKYFAFKLLAVLMLSCCDARVNDGKKKVLNSDNAIFYCEKELELILNYSSEEMLIINIDTIQSLNDLRGLIKAYYNVDCMSFSVNKVCFTFTHTKDSLLLRGEDISECIVIGFRNIICMTEPIYPDPSRSIYYYTLVADTNGAFIDFSSPFTKSEKEILETTFDSFFREDDLEDDVKKVCNILIHENLSMKSLKLLLNKVISAFISEGNKYSEKQYLRSICELPTSEYKFMSQHNKLNIEFEVLKDNSVMYQMCCYEDN